MAFKNGSTEWKRVETLFKNHLDGSKFEINSITAVVCIASLPDQFNSLILVQSNACLFFLKQEEGN